MISIKLSAFGISGFESGNLRRSGRVAKKYHSGLVGRLALPRGEEKNHEKNRQRYEYQNDTAQKVVVPVRMPSKQIQQADDDKKDKDDDKDDSGCHIVHLSSFGMPVALASRSLKWQKLLFLCYK